MKIGHKLGLVLFLGLFGLNFSGCRPSYPKCDTDEHCEEQAEYCLNGQCQECREDTQCELKNGRQNFCHDGRCEFVAECQNDMDCAAKDESLVCKQGLCDTECTADSGESCALCTRVARLDQDFKFCILSVHFRSFFLQLMLYAYAYA